MSSARDRLEAEQADLLCALQRGEGGPAGLPPGDLKRTGNVLRSKRRRTLASCVPVTVTALGPDFPHQFELFAQQSAPLEDGKGPMDARAFLHFLQQRGRLPREAQGEARQLGLRTSRWLRWLP